MRKIFANHTILILLLEETIIIFTYCIRNKAHRRYMDSKNVCASFNFCHALKIAKLAKLRLTMNFRYAVAITNNLSIFQAVYLVVTMC